MRPPLAVPLACLALASCVVAPPRPDLEVAADGRSAVHRGTSWVADQGIVFFQRGASLHAVSLIPGKPLDVAAEVGPDGALRWPDDPRIEATAGSVRWRAELSGVAARIATGELHPHEEHLHLTHRYANADLQALYQAREDRSPFPPIRRQVAAALVAMLIEQKLPGGSEATASAGLVRIDRVLSRLHRAFDAGVAAPALADILSHDFEIIDAGHGIVIEDQAFRAAGGLRFGYCAGHFHVEDEGERWAQVVEFGQPGAQFAFPESPLFAVTADGLVAPLPGPKLWRDLLESGQIQMLRDHWHLTAKFAEPALDRLRALAESAEASEEVRTKARNSIFELMRLKLDLHSGTTFDASVAAVREAAARALAEIEPPAPAPAPAAKKPTKGK
ncbi:MAG TPA: hypothetical protein VGK67_24380 [Myxococcales bacterium]|jgi:hypothetical protein